MKRIVLWMVFFLMVGMPIKAQNEQDHNFEVVKNLEIFNALYRQLDMLYVDTLDADKMVGAGIKGMLQRLDPYTVYYPKASDLKSFLTGKYGGIGALIRYHMKDKTTVIDEPMGDTPAQEAGLRKGDIILSIDDTVMVGKGVEYVREHLRGEPGTTFALKIRRPSTNKVMQMKITRRSLSATPTIPYYGMQGDGIGYICLTQFTEGCAQEVRRAFLDLKKQGMQSLVLDLRNNGGGSELEAAQLVNIFVPRGITVASNRGKLRRANHDYQTTVEPIDTVMPLVVLVNEETASSSEITSGALQDLDRAVKVLVVGNPANTNAYIAMKSAPDLPAKNFTAMLRLDHNRALSQLSEKTGKPVAAIEKMCVWGNHSPSMYADYRFATIDGASVKEMINDHEWYANTFLPTVGKRGAAIIEARGLSSAASAANAAIDHIRDWVLGTNGKWVTMGIPSDGSYGIEKDIISGFPVTCENGEYKIVQGLEIDAFSQGLIDKTIAELKEEQAGVAHLLK